jgi:hypothetical protein
VAIQQNRNKQTRRLGAQRCRQGNRRVFDFVAPLHPAFTAFYLPPFFCTCCRQFGAWSAELAMIFRRRSAYPLFTAFYLPTFLCARYCQLGAWSAELAIAHRLRPSSWFSILAFLAIMAVVAIGIAIATSNQRKKPLLYNVAQSLLIL